MNELNEEQAITAEIAELGGPKINLDHKMTPEQRLEVHNFHIERLKHETGLSKYDTIQVSVVQPNGDTYPLSRFLIARTLTACNVSHKEEEKSEKSQI